MVIRDPTTVVKSPREQLEVTFDFFRRIPAGATLAGATITTDAGIAVVSSVLGSTMVKVVFGGGTVGVQYRAMVLCTVNGQNIKPEIAMQIRVEEPN